MIMYNEMRLRFITVCEVDSESLMYLGIYFTRELYLLDKKEWEK